MGRVAIDEEAMRLLEQHNPDVQFDWTRMLKQPAAPQPEPRRSDGRDAGRDRGKEQSDQLPAFSSQLSASSSSASSFQPPASSSQLSADSSQLPASRGSASESESVDTSQPPASSSQLSAANSQPSASSSQLPAEPVEPVEPVEPLEPLELAEPEPLKAESWQLEADIRAEPEPLEAESWQLEADTPLEPVEPELLKAESWELEADIAPRYARLGAAGLAQLRARYREVIARLDEKPLEPAVKEELRAKAERLNPDAWGTEEEVADALEQYESVFEQLRPLVGRYPRRRRRRRV